MIRAYSNIYYVPIYDYIYLMYWQKINHKFTLKSDSIYYIQAIAISTHIQYKSYVIRASIYITKIKSDIEK